MELLAIIWGGFVASVVWFIISSILYMNPFIANIYKRAEKSPGLKKWTNIPKYIALQYVGIAVRSFLWAFIFDLVKPVLPPGVLGSGFVFGLILVATTIFPRFFDMWIQSTYPNKLLAVEFTNGTIGSFVIGLTLAYFI